MKVSHFLFLIGFVAFFLNLNPSLAHVLVQMNERGFYPQTIEIGQGNSVIFLNTGNQPHWPASNIHPTHLIYPEFDPKKPILPNQSWTFEFDKAGEWKFHDHLNPLVTGTIIVKAVEGFSPPTISES